MTEEERIVVSSKPSIAVTLADVLQYVVPGGAFIAACLLFEMRARSGVIGTAATFHTPFLTSLELAMNRAPNARWLGAPRTDAAADASGHMPGATPVAPSQLPTPGEDWVFSVFVGLGILMAAYVVGHVLASFSAMTVDRILIAKGHGYPFETLLGTNVHDGHERAKRSFYRGAFMWINLFLLSIWVCFAARMFDPAGWQWNAALIAAAVAFFAGYMLVRGLQLKLTLKRTDTVVKEEPRSFRWFARPYDAGAGVISRLIDTTRGFDDAFVDEFWIAFESVFGKRVVSRRPSTNVWWLTYCYVLEGSPVLRGPIENWLRLYAFSRNLATALFFAFMYSTIWLGWQGTSEELRGVSQGLWLLPLVLLSAAVVMLIRYYYLYYAYLSKFTLRAFVYMNRDAIKASAGQNR